MKKRVVITGMGAITPIGNSVNEFSKSLFNGVNGISNITQFDTEFIGLLLKTLSIIPY